MASKTKESMIQESRKEPLRRSPTQGGATCSRGPVGPSTAHHHPGTRRASRRWLRFRHQQPRISPSKEEPTTQEACQGDLQRRPTLQTTRRSRGAKSRTAHRHAGTQQQPRQRLRDTGRRILQPRTKTGRIRQSHQASRHDPGNRNRPAILRAPGGP